MNSICIIGRLVGEPKEIGKGEACGTALRLAYDQAGKGTTTGYVDVVTWGPTAVSCLAFLGKGDEIAVIGRLNYSEWKTKDKKQFGHNIIASKVDFLRKKLPHEEDQAI